MWTLMCNNKEDRVSAFGLVSSPTRIRVSIEFYKSYITSGRSKGGRPRHAPPPTDQNFLHFMQYLGKSGKFVY